MTTPTGQVSISSGSDSIIISSLYFLCDLPQHAVWELLTDFLALCVAVLQNLVAPITLQVQMVLLTQAQVSVDIAISIGR